MQEKSGNVTYINFRFLHHIIPICPVLRNVPNTPNFLCAGNVHKMSHVLLCNSLFMPESAYRKCKGNVLEMSYVLATGNVPKISCVLVQEMCLKFCPILHQEKSRKFQNFLL